jgi:uncharacterized protein (DUF924 family)
MVVRSSTWTRALTNHDQQDIHSPDRAAIADIHAFWFGDEFAGSDDVAVANRKQPLWWGKNKHVDIEVRERFGGLIERAARGELAAWSDDASARLSLILLTDQFPRNSFRGQPQSYATDTLALTEALAGIEGGDDRRLRPIERVFFYMPLEHSEVLAHQDQVVDLFVRLAAEVPPEQSPTFEGFVNFARRHQEFIRRFGRFPHRNTILGRESTAEELAFLKQPGSSF